MKRTRFFAAVGTASLFLAGLTPPMADANQHRGRAPAASPATRAAQQEFTRAVRAGEEVPIAEALKAVWEADAASGVEASMHLIQRARPHMSALGVGAMTRWADAGALSEAASSLNAARNRDERRLLVRAIGASEDIDALERLRPFLRDSDELVQAAAINAIADTGRLEGLELFADRYPVRPPEESRRTDRLALELTIRGAVRTLTGRGFDTSTDLQRWMRDMSGPGGGGAVRPEAERRLSDQPPARDGRFSTPSFDGRFMIADLEVELRDAGAPGWRELFQGVEETASNALDGATIIFGTPHLPEIELIFADDRSIASAGGGPRAHYGVRKPGKIVLRLESWDEARAALANLMIHSVEIASFPAIPRWLSEGVAESLTRSRERTMWTGPLSAGAGLEAEIRRGVFTTARQWVGDVGANEDPRLYQLAHLAVDYLRFGGFSEPEIRLSMLMGRLARGESEAAALNAVYGLSMRELDAGARAWLGAE